MKFNFLKDENRIALEAPSPKQLDANLTETIEKKGVKPCAVAVSINEPKVMICPFVLENTAIKDLEHHLLSEAVEIMSLTSDEIAIDFQITRSDSKMIRGIYMCMPKNDLEKYIRVLDQKRFNTVKITEQFLVSVDSLFQQGKLNGERICFLDFLTKDTISLFIGNQQECELLRKVHYEDYEEAQKEIVQSLRSASAKSRTKHYDYIYCHGTIEQMDQLMDSLNKTFDTETEEITFIDCKAALTNKKTYFRLNFLRNYLFSQHYLKYIQMGANILLALCVMISALMGFQMLKKDINISKVKGYYQDSEYQYAVQLRDNLK